MNENPISPPDLWVQYRDHVTKNLQRLRNDQVCTAGFISQMGDYFVLQKYPYRIIVELMSQIHQLSEQISSSSFNSLPALSSPSSRSLEGHPSLSQPNSPIPNRNLSTPGSPETPSASSTSSIGGSMASVPTLVTASSGALVEFESPGEWYRALEMVRSVEAHRDKMRSSGGKSRKPPIQARLL